MLIIIFLSPSYTLLLMREHGLGKFTITIKVKKLKINLLFHMFASYGALFCLILHFECYDEI